MSSPPESPQNPFSVHGTPGEPRTTGGADSSNETNQRGSAGRRPREKKRVGFTGGSGPENPSFKGSTANESPVSPGKSPNGLSPDNASPDISQDQTPTTSRRNSFERQPAPDVYKSHLPELSTQQTREIHQAFEQAMPIARPRPAIRRAISADATLPQEDIEGPDETGQRALRRARAQEAFERGKRLEEDERSAPPSRYSSPERRPRNDITDISTQDFSNEKYDSEDSDGNAPESRRLRRAEVFHNAEAHRLVRKHISGKDPLNHDAISPASSYRSGATTPTEEQDFAHDYRPPPDRYRSGVLGALLKLYNAPQGGGGHSRNSSITSLPSRSGDWDSTVTTPQQSPPDSGSATPSGTLTPTGPQRLPKKAKHKRHSSSSLAQLIGSSASLSSPAFSGLGEEVSHRLKEQREEERRIKAAKRARSANPKHVVHRLARTRVEDEIKITVHIAETIARQKYLMLLCKALMMYGAPTHRLEEYMKMSARVLEVNAQFLYIPGSMIMSFDDAETHTTEVKLVKTSQGLDLSKLRDVHEVYKEVVHDMIGVEEATSRIKACIAGSEKFSRWIRIPVFGLAAACVGPYAFGARLIDLPIAFLLGCILGVMQLVIAPASELYANVFEIAAAVVLSFLARAFGSIPYHSGRLFCFSALAQSSIALILPGYIVLCASLELQSKNLVAGSVRMVYAIIYSLFLGFGLTIGIAIYGLVDSNATSDVSCSNPMPEYWFFFFVPLFAICLGIVNQAKWKQMPAMVIIAFVGYVVNYFSSIRFAGNTQISSTLGALSIGVLANLYSRLGSKMENWALDQWEDRLRPRWRKVRKASLLRRRRRRQARTPKGLEEGGDGGNSAASTGNDDASVYVRQERRVGYSLAAAAMLPAIFVLVPSGLGIQGSLVSGLASANQIVGSANNGTTVVNSTTIQNNGQVNDVAFNVGYGVVQVAIGITVGLFLSAIVVYPVGKRRSGLFSF